jgi:DNA-binding HxlR family transcriptional regulator
VSQRTVERQLKELCDMGLLEKKPLPEHINSNGHTMGYDLRRLVSELESLTKGEAKSGKLAERIKELRAARAAAAVREDND